MFSALSGKEKVILFLGKVDTGKTTAVTILANELISKGKKVGIIDADPGQSDIGPPGTIGLGFPEGKIDKLSDVPPVKLAFVGSTSPGGQFLWPTVWGLSHLLAFSREKRDVVLVDSSGLVTGRDGYILTKSKVLVAKPDIVFFLGDMRDYEHLVKEFSLYAKVELLPSPFGVRVKTPEERRANRIRMWRRYFMDSMEVELAWDSLEIGGFPHFGMGAPLGKEALRLLSFKVGAEVLWAEATDGRLRVLLASYPENTERLNLEWMHIGALKHTLIGLEGGDGLIDVGLVLEVNERGLLIKTPSVRIGKIRRLLVSRLKVDEEVFNSCD